MKRILNFLADWDVDGLGIKPVFQSLFDELAKQEKVILEWVHRPGVSYSLRATHKLQKARPYFVMIDVMDDDPDQRWLSICFYRDMITDPENLGDILPEGLPGADGYCFEINEPDQHLLEYMRARIGEALEIARIKKHR
jgi:hypothetical protein